MISYPKNFKIEVLHKIIALLFLEMCLMMPRLAAAILNVAIYSGSGGLNQQTKYIIMFSGPTNIKNEVLHKIIVLSVLMMHLLVLHMVAILNITIYDRSGDRPSRRPGEIELVWYKLHLGQIWPF